MKVALALLTRLHARFGAADDFRKSEERRAIIRTLIDGGPMRPTAIAQALGKKPGTIRAGLPGALMAWLGFTLPSALALMLFGYGIQQFAVGDAGWLHGLKIAAVAVVAQAVWGMSRNLAPDRERASIAIVAAIVALAWPTMATPALIIVVAGLVGWRLLPAPVSQEERVAISK
ncbi:MAG: chromate transporter, partial [Proteobacteria bacterium]|nr:chromate transporter [Pseudomonadota bacterium]